MAWLSYIDTKPQLQHQQQVNNKNEIRGGPLVTLMVLDIDMDLLSGISKKIAWSSPKDSFLLISDPLCDNK